MNLQGSSLLLFVLAVSVGFTAISCAVGYFIARKRIQKTLRFQVPRGIIVSKLDGIFEAYAVTTPEKGPVRIDANISAENIFQTFLALGNLVKSPGFGILEMPTNEKEEQKLRVKDTDPFYNDVFHLPQTTFSEYRKVIYRLEQWIVHDGMVNCGFACHEPFDEVFIGSYKVFRIFTNTPDKYVTLLKRRGLPRVKSLTTHWQNISSTSPGQRNRISVVGETIFDIVDKELIPKGWMLYERRAG